MPDDASVIMFQQKLGECQQEEELRKHKIRLAILNRMQEATTQCNSTWFMHNDGVIRGLLWALTGKDPGTWLLQRYPEKILKLAGIPYTKDKEMLHWSYDGPQEEGGGGDE